MVGQAKIRWCILFNIHCFTSCLINVASTFHVFKYNYSADFTQEILRIDNIVFMKVDHNLTIVMTQKNIPNPLNPRG